MVELVAKRYVKALMSKRDNESLSSIFNELKSISTAFGDKKFLSIITSTEVSKDKKVELILSFVDQCNDATKNLIKLLGDNNRLNVIPNIVSDLENELAVINNSYKGVIHTNVELSDDEVSKLNQQFSKKFDVELTLTQNICDYDGIKVDIDGLGVEVGFSKERLKSQMIEHILKAV
ncbi:MAG: F0F1 ATP synthase subunit delta, partial [Campylobacterota bacterium]|nr:F0F1 ATP synthase subunit delta [Campylobacterota bacterium]